MIPRIYNHSYTISADLSIPEGGAEGVIVAEADHLGGFSLFVQDGKLKHTYSMLGVLEFTPGGRAAAADRRGAASSMVFAADEAKPATGGEVTLLVNDEPVGKGRMEHTVPGRFSGYAGMDIGRDNGLRRRPQLRGQGAVRLHRRRQEGRLRRRPAPERRGRAGDPRARPAWRLAAHARRRMSAETCEEEHDERGRDSSTS